MINEIPTTPTSIRPSTGEVAKRGLVKQEKQEGKGFKRSRAEENYIPAPETLKTLIRNALAALKEGITFDRGSIVNLVV